jgi:ribosomal protein S18 acetylase RimI-like enzyme
MTDVTIAVERLTEFGGTDVNDLCDAAEAAILDGGGFGWVKAPPRHVFETYWRGVMLVPERLLFVGRLDGVVAGAAQLLRPSRNNEAQAHAATLTGAFVAPWARGHGLARGLTQAVETAAGEAGYRVLNLDVRATQTAAIALYEARGFTRWGTHPHYAFVAGEYVAGYYYTKELRAASA